MANIGSKCPAALEKLNKLSTTEDMTNIIFVSCALSLGDGNEDLVKDMIDEWEDLTHVFVSVETKEYLKKILSFSAVPFAILTNKVCALQILIYFISYFI